MRVLLAFSLLMGASISPGVAFEIFPGQNIVDRNEITQDSKPFFENPDSFLTGQDGYHITTLKHKPERVFA